jgi:glycerol-3-phosphate acyltransferase PlsX
MGQKIIALDAMGGDYGPPVTVGAAKMALDEISGLELVLVGDQNQLGAELEKHGLGKDNRVSIHHASESTRCRTQKEERLFDASGYQPGQGRLGAGLCQRG